MNAYVNIRGFRLVATVLLVLGFVSVVDGQSWADRLKGKIKEGANKAKQKVREKTDEAKRKIKERERRCADCGKTIHVGNRCAACSARLAREKAKAASDKARRAWRDSADERENLKRRVREGGRAVQRHWRESADERRHLMGQVRRGAERAKSFTHDLQTEYRKRQPQLREAWERADRWSEQHKRKAAQFYQTARREYGPRVMRAIRDPENQRRAFETIGALHAAHVQFQDLRHEATYRTIKLAGQIPVDTPHGRMTVEAVAKRRLLEEFPMLRGTPLVEDPAVPLTHLITGDREYFFEEMPLVESNGRKVSVKDAMIEASPFDPDETMKLIAIYEAADDVSHTLTTGEGTMDAIGSTLTAVELVNEG